MNRLLDLLIVLTQKELRTRYKNLSLGYLWSLGNPLAHGLIYYVVFKLIMNVKTEAYPLFLITALFPWQWFSNSIGASAMTFISNASLIKKVNFPRNLLSLVVGLQDMIHFFAAIPIIFIFMYIYHKTPSPWLIVGIPLLAVLQLAYTYSLNLLIATVNLFFRDLERLVSIIMTFVFYMTPIVYSADMIPEGYKHYVFYNPAAPLMIAWRELFFNGVLHFEYIAVAAGYAGALLIISHLVYKKLSWRFAEVL